MKKPSAKYFEIGAGAQTGLGAGYRGIVTVLRHISGFISEAVE